MRELAVGAAILIVGLVTVFNQSLADFKTPSPQGTPVVVTAPVIMPTSGVPVAAPPAAPIPTIGPATSGLPGDFVAAVIADAMRWVNARVPYLWGGCSFAHGVDCSCFVRNVLGDFGYQLPRTTVEQVKWATHVDRANVQPLDLIFYDNTCTGCGPNPTHVALYIGNGMMINAGDPVQIGPAFTSKFAEIGRPHK